MIVMMEMNTTKTGSFNRNRKLSKAYLGTSSRTIYQSPTTTKTQSRKQYACYSKRMIPLSTSLLSVLLALDFGIGAWVGMNYANTTAEKGLQVSLFSACHEYEVCVLNGARKIYFPKHMDL